MADSAALLQQDADGSSSGVPLALLGGVAAVGLTVLYLLCKRTGPRGGAAGRPRKSAKAIRSTVLLAGPAGSGKTAMLHQLAFGRGVETVTSMRENTLTTQLAAHKAEGLPVGPDAPVVSLVDFPGLGNLRSALLRTASVSGAIVFVLDAAFSSDHAKEAADLLFDLFTQGSVADAAPAMLIACNKADAAGAQPVERIRVALEEEIERLRVSRSAVATAAAAGGDAADADGDDAVPRPLGVQGRRFTFAADAPFAVEWAACSSVAPAVGAAGGGAATDRAPGLAPVEAFIVQAVSS